MQTRFKAQHWNDANGNPAGGSTYGNGKADCACLVGTIGNAKGVRGETLDHDSGRPAERWFMMISKGAKPDDNSPGGDASGKAVEWALEYCEAIGIEHPWADETQGDGVSVDKLVAFTSS